MESVAPTLELVLHLRASIENGESVGQSVRQFCAGEHNNELRMQIRLFLAKYQSGVELQKSLPDKCSSHRRILFQLIHRGLEGSPILSHLQDVQTEIFERCQVDLESFSAALPFKMMIPLLFFLFPAFAILFLGPILAELMSSLG